MWYILGYWLYSLGVNSFFALLKIVALFNERAQLFVKGRKNLISHITQTLHHDSRKSIWFHVASLGEFEQARPVIEQLKLLYPNHKFIITIFSPSGYEPLKNDTVADYIFYLPKDSKKNAAQLFQLFNPSMAFWVKYDFWFHYLNILKNNKIPVFLIDASLNSKQLYFKNYAIFYRKLLGVFDFIFTQNETSTKLLNSIQINQVETTGDTRFDRVYNALQQTENLPLIEEFKGNDLLLVIGSSYQLEEEILANFLRNSPPISYKLILAPHFINEERLIEIEKIFPEKVIRYSQINATNITNYQTLIIDNIGMLSKIYKYADISFVGGGFKEKGLHNILEAATFGNAIIFGNKISYFPEAVIFRDKKAAISIQNQQDFDLAFKQLMENNAFRKNIGTKAQQLILENVGATKKIIQYISKAYLHLN